MQRAREATIFNQHCCIFVHQNPQRQYWEIPMHCNIKHQLDIFPRQGWHHHKITAIRKSKVQARSALTQLQSSRIRTIGTQGSHTSRCDDSPNEEEADWRDPTNFRHCMQSWALQNLGTPSPHPRMVQQMYQRPKNSQKPGLNVFQVNNPTTQQALLDQVCRCVA